MAMTARRVVLKSRPVGAPKPGDFSIVESPVPATGAADPRQNPELGRQSAPNCRNGQDSDTDKLSDASCSVLNGCRPAA